MKTNDYIRHSTDGIQRIIKLFSESGKEYVHCANNCDYRVKNVLKCSSNLLDLIEEGDFINGHRVVKKYNINSFLVEDYNGPERVRYIKTADIKTILTKEQYSTHDFEIG